MTQRTQLGPHQGQPILAAGEKLGTARAAMILIHGRGASADDILGLSAAFDAPGFIFLAPQAANSTWYPARFIEPLAHNEPYLTSALNVIADLVAHVGENGIPPEKVMLVGFSQGACLTLEFAARNPRRYGGIAGLSGGLIGPDDLKREIPDTKLLAGTPAFLGCSDVDFHIPLARVKQATLDLRALGAEVTERIYPRMGHQVNDDEIAFVQGMIAALNQ